MAFFYHGTIERFFHTFKDDQRKAQEAEDIKAENRKSRPKALDFWESLNNATSSISVGPVDDDDEEEEDSAPQDDFRYNTIHRMSMGRRMLPRWVYTMSCL
jgi:hypothetical protein